MSTGSTMLNPLILDFTMIPSTQTKLFFATKDLNSNCSASSMENSRYIDYNISPQKGAE